MVEVVGHPMYIHITTHLPEVKLKQGGAKQANSFVQCIHQACSEFR